MRRRVGKARLTYDCSAGALNAAYRKAVRYGKIDGFHGAARGNHRGTFL